MLTVSLIYIGETADVMEPYETESSAYAHTPYSCETVDELQDNSSIVAQLQDINSGITAERINGFARNGHFRNIFTQGLHASMKALRPTDAMCHITSATEIYVFNGPTNSKSRTLPPMPPAKRQA